MTTPQIIKSLPPADAEADAARAARMAQLFGDMHDNARRGSWIAPAVVIAAAIICVALAIHLFGDLGARVSATEAGSDAVCKEC